jgi:hypothetical protein
MNQDQKRHWETLSSAFEYGFVRISIYNSSMLEILKLSTLDEDQTKRMNILTSAHEMKFVDDQIFSTKLSEILEELTEIKKVNKRPRFSILDISEMTMSFLLRNLPKSSFTASSSYPNHDTTPTDCLIYCGGPHFPAWAPATDNKDNCWLQIDFLTPHLISEFMMSGRRLESQCTLTFEIHYKPEANSTEWIRLPRSGSDKTFFDGPKDTKDSVRITAPKQFDHFVCTVLRVYPKTYSRYPTINWDIKGVKV